MFTGIVRGLVCVKQIIHKSGVAQLTIQTPLEWHEHIKIGSSISIDGVCLTLISIINNYLFFDVIGETLQRTTLSLLKPGDKVNFERSARLGEEIGGHLLSGHVYGMVSIQEIDRIGGNCAMRFTCDHSWMKYLFKKGFIAIDGVSLTIVDLAAEGFTVHLIPETLRRTTLGLKKAKDKVNIEFDVSTQQVVDTVQRMMEMKKNREG